MNPVTPYLETAGVLVVAVAGFLLGWRVGKRTKGWMWAAAYAAPLILTLAIAVARRIPSMEFTIPFKWIMMDRMEFVVLAFLITFMLTIPAARLTSIRQQRFVITFMWLVIVNYALLPFLMPGLNYAYLRDLKNTMARGGICLQSTDYTCGPAAAVTALKQLGVTAEEGKLAILAHTTRIAGTPPDSLCAAINRLHQAEGIRCTYREYQSIAEIKQVPVIAVVKFGFLVDHYVTVLEVTDTTVEIGDPLEGKVSLSHSKFNNQWRRCGILVEKRH